MISQNKVIAAIENNDDKLLEEPNQYNVQSAFLMFVMVGAS